MANHKDVVLAILGAAAGLAGLVLVFLGLVISTFQGLESPVADTIRTRYKRLAELVILAFVMGLASVTVATLWLIQLRDNQALYLAAVATFLSCLGLLLVATLAVTQRLLWKKG